MLTGGNSSQKVQGVDNGMVNQAMGNITVYQGMTVSEVRTIVKDVVALELSQYSKAAEHTLAERLTHFSDKLEDHIIEKVSDRLDRFSEPSTQFALREAAIGYVKSGSEIDEDNLIDLLIERVKSDEHTTMQKIIDQAIQIVPTLSSASLALLSLLAYRSIQLRGTKEEYAKWIESMNPLIDKMPLVTAIDREFLLQTGCVTTLGGLQSYIKWEDISLKAADLVFRHPFSEESVNLFLSRIGIERVDQGFTFPQSTSDREKEMMFFISVMIGPEMQVGFNLVSTGSVNKTLQNNGLERLQGPVMELINSAPLFSQEEVLRYFEGYNANWRRAVELLDGQELSSFRLTPVGAYVACRQIKRLSGKDVPMTLFFGE